MGFFGKRKSAPSSAATLAIIEPPTVEAPTVEPLPPLVAYDGSAEELVTGNREYAEIEVVGESRCQDALELLAGSRDESSKFELRGVTLRCEPDNQWIHRTAFDKILGR